MKRLLDIKKDMFLYAPDDVFKSFTSWTLELNKPNSAVNHFKLYFKIMKLVRKDMGQNGSKIELDDFMLFLMQNEDAYLYFKQEHICKILRNFPLKSKSNVLSQRKYYKQ